MANRLAEELSPYLRQHAHNPVDWYPWGDEALQKAKVEDKPILLSIGYSACHWCHVMERESFDEERIATLMNELFVSIKVDREERPDLDKIYQTAVQLMTRRAGGWPLTVFLTPDLAPFYGGTYFPPESRHGMPGFPEVLRSVASAYADKKHEIRSMAGDVVEALRSLELDQTQGDASPDVAIAAARKLTLRYDERYGGFGDAPKFPNSSSLEVLLRAYRRTGDDTWLARVTQSVDAMIDGGIHDQLGGGFHRYATDARWRVPHFEKMLYDNALIGRLLVDLWRVTRDDSYRSTCVSLLEYVEREMSSSEGGFFATQDADSEGREGAFFVWTLEELEDALGEDDAALAALYYGVDEAGNFEGGATVLHRTRSVEALADKLGIDRSDAERRLERIRQMLFDVRELRPKPFRDEKIVTSWNGLMAGTFAEAGAAFGEPRFIARATEALTFLRDEVWNDSELFRVAKDGARQGSGFLVDYADTCNAALDLYEATFETAWAGWSEALARAALRAFWDDDAGQLYFAQASDDLVVRGEDNVDGEVPSGSSSMLRALLRLEALTGDETYRTVANRVLERRAGAAADNPFAYGNLVGVVDFWVRGPCHVLFVDGDAEVPETASLRQAARSTYVPNRLLTSGSSPASNAVQVLGALPTEPGAYVCRDHTCTPPVQQEQQLVALLERS